MTKKDNMYYMWRLSDRFYDIVEGKDAYFDQEFFEDNSVESMMSYIARNFDEARALVDVLENSHLDDDYTPEKRYKIEHLDSVDKRNAIERAGGNPDRPVKSEKTRAETLKRLSEIANDDFGDDPDEWRSWYEAWKADPPPFRYR